MINRSYYPVFWLAALLIMVTTPAVDSRACDKSTEPTITIQLSAAPEYAGDATMQPDSLVIPDGRPIYALFVHGYTQNRNFDQLMLYNFAKRLMADGAYVHYAWWNNLCAEYMARPLHQYDSHPGDMNIVGLLDPDLGDKAKPAEDYQFQADADSFLVAVRRNNPSAIIIVAGHSMGGGAVARLATNTDVVIDILAPLDPVENRTAPQGRLPNVAFVLFADPYPPVVYPDFNYTRWRITRREFLGYKQHVCTSWNGDVCEACAGYGNHWYGFFDLPIPHSLPRNGVFNTNNDCGYDLIYFPGNPIPMNIWYPYLDDPEQRTFGSHVINLLHRYQKEYFFPFDYLSNEEFGHILPPGGTTSQGPVATCSNGDEPGGYQNRCWDADGHGEIVGFRGPTGLTERPYPIGLQAQGDWPTGHVDPDACERRRLLIEMPDADAHNTWQHRPYNPNLCKVSQPLIDLYQYMNKPPVANAGADRTVAYSAEGVILDGSGSTDPEDDALSYTWQGPFGQVEGEITTVTMAEGTHEITLTVGDPSGHIARDRTSITIMAAADQPTTRMVGAHPNPFNLTVRVSFEVAKRRPVLLQVFDLQGRLVRLLEDRVFEPGQHEAVWNGIDDAGRAVPSGGYIVRMRAGERMVFTKVALIK